jgi:NAD(P)-dependent dehydrogenase (short-subunit alcohol dehydrogenase family)
MCMTLFEQGCSIIYGIDIVATPSTEFLAVKSFAKLLGAEFLYHKVNVTDPVAIAAFYQIVQDERGRLDVCICAAGILGKFAIPRYAHDILALTPAHSQNIPNVLTSRSADI